MEYRQLGRTGIEVSRLILGCGSFGGIGSMHELVGKGESEREAAVLMDRAWELGITTFDTADAYAGGASERAIGAWMRARGVSPVVMTKVFHPMAPGADQGLSPARIRRQLDSSLDRLGVEQIALYVTHAPDNETPLDETLEVLQALTAEGTIGAFGGSNIDHDLLRRAGGRYAFVQNRLSLLDRADETGILPRVAEQGLGYTPFSPLAGGWLADRYTRDAPAPPDSRMAHLPTALAHLDTEAVWRGMDLLRGRASQYGVPMATLAYAWVLSDPRVSAILIGPRRVGQFEPAIAALDLHLTERERRELELFFSTDEGT